jgi:hypothetical protein
MSPWSVATTVDAVQTAAIITLTIVICLLVRRSDIRFNRQHRDIQDVILNQYQILKQMNEHQGKIELLDERIAKFEGRVRQIESP